jgi:hypothetical protein
MPASSSIGPRWRLKWLVSHRAQMDLAVVRAIVDDEMRLGGVSIDRGA